MSLQLVNGSGVGGVLEDAPPSDYKEHRMKDTGKVVWIRKISPFLAREVRRAYPPPTPPMNEIRDENGNIISREPNEADPDYIHSKRAYEEELTGRLVDLALTLGVHFVFDDAKRQQVQELRDTLRATLKIELPEDDRIVWLKHIAIGTPEDLNELAQAVFQRAGPTEEVIQEAAKNFRR